MVYKILLIHLLRLLYSSLAVANVQGARHAPHHQYQGARTCRGDVQRSSAAQRSWLQTYRIVPRRRLHSCDRKKNCNNFLPPRFSRKRYIVSVMKKGYTSIFPFSQLIRKEREELKLLEEEEFSFFLQVKID